MDAAKALRTELTAAMTRMGLATGASLPTITELTGGISSDIWRIDLPGGPVVAKRALVQLRVAETWEVPLQRNHYEVAWLTTVAAIAPAGASTGSGEALNLRDGGAFYSAGFRIVKIKR